MLFLKAFLLMKPPFWKKLVGLAKVIQNASETFYWMFISSGIRLVLGKPCLLVEDKLNSAS